MRYRVKQTLLFALPTLALAMMLSLVVSANSLRADDPPACDGVECTLSWMCGTKCICNPLADICLDNTEEEQ